MTMERKLYWGIGILSVMIFVGTFFIPGKSSEKNDLPWHIEHPAPGMVRVFGLTLGSSTASEAERRFQEESQPSLFKSPDGQLVAEMFFEQVTLAGLKSRIVVNIAVPDVELQAMYGRGLRISGVGNSKKIPAARVTHQQPDLHAINPSGRGNFREAFRPAGPAHQGKGKRRGALAVSAKWFGHHLGRQRKARAAIRPAQGLRQAAAALAGQRRSAWLARRRSPDMRQACSRNFSNASCGNGRLNRYL